MIRAGAWPVGIACLLLSVQAAAQSDQALGTRQELIGRAVEASKAGDHTSALSLAKRAGVLRMTPSLRMFIAQEQQELGRVAEAYGNARQCAAEAEADLALDDRARILARCRALESALVGRVAHVVVTLPAPVPHGTRVRVSGEEIDLALLGTALVVSPGEVTVSVTAPGFAPYETQIPLAEAAEAEIAPRLEPLAPAAGPPGTVAPPPAGPAAPSRRGSVWAGPVVLAGTGLVAAGLGTVVWVAGNTRYTQLQSRCEGPGGCSPTEYDSGRTAVRRDDAIGVTGWTAGAALLAGGALWYLLGSGKAAPVHGSAVVGPGSWSGVVGGTF